MEKNDVKIQYLKLFANKALVNVPKQLDFIVIKILYLCIFQKLITFPYVARIIGY